MNVGELSELSKWVRTEISEPRIREQYSALAEAVTQNAQGQRIAIEAQKTGLLQALRNVDLSRLTKDQLELLGYAQLAQLVGEAGASAVESVLFDGAIDIVTASKRLETMTSTVAAGIERFKKLGEGLRDLPIDTTIQTAREGEVLLRVTFAGDASISNVVDLKEWGTNWHTIARGIAMAHDEPPETVRVVGASNGSIIIELATTYAVAKTASIVILESLKVTERVLSILEQVEKVKGMHLSNKKIAQELQKEADKERAEGVSKITDDTCKNLGVSQEGNGDKFNALESAIRNLVGFLTKGGEVDCVVPEAKEGEQEIKDIRGQVAQNFQEIRLLEEKTRRLGHSAPPGGA